MCTIGMPLDFLYVRFASRIGAQTGMKTPNRTLPYFTRLDLGT